MDHIFTPFLLTILAGMTTMIGTFLIFKKKTNDDFLSSTMSFAAGVMIGVSVIDLIPESFEYFKNNYQLKVIPLFCSLFIVIGILISIFIDKSIKKTNVSNNVLYKVGLMSMISLILHNIPEGIITFLTSTVDIKLGISLAIAIALHNIPEGISISVPIYYSTKSKIKAILYTLISAFSEPLGAIIAYLFITKYINFTLMGILLSITAGIMIYISFYELLPISFKYKNKKRTFYFFMIGIILMIIKTFI